MNTSHLIDLDQVAAYWKSRKLVDDIHLAFYIRWLSRFLVGPGGNPRLSAMEATRRLVRVCHDAYRTAQTSMAC